MAPKFTIEVVTREAVRVVGMKVRTDMASAPDDCPRLWREIFGPRMPEVATFPGPSYGASLMVDEEHFDYWAALPYREGDPVPPGMALLDLAGGLYAECRLESLADLAAGYQFLFESRSDRYEARFDVPGYEFYPADHMSTGRLSLCVPLRLKENP